MRFFQKLYHFFVWCAGSDFEILNRAPRYEHIIHAIFGALVWIPAIMNTIAMAFAFNSIGVGFLGSAIIGLFWGTVIFIIERYFVASRPLNKDKANIAIRLILSLMLSVLVAHSLIIFIFRNEIKFEMEASVTMEVKKIVKGDANWKMLAFDKDSLRGKLNFHIQQHNDLGSLSLTESKGGIDSILFYGKTLTTTGKSNKGEFYRDIISKKIEEDSIVKSIDTLILKIQNEIDTIENNTRIHVVNSNTSIIKKILTLDKLEHDNFYLKIIKWFLAFLLILIDILPISLKYTSNNSKHYDQVIQEYEIKSPIFSDYYHNRFNIVAYETDKEIEQRKKIIDAGISSESFENPSAYLKIGIVTIIHLCIASALAGAYYLGTNSNPDTITLCAIVSIYFLSAIIFEISRK